MRQDQPRWRSRRAHARRQPRAQRAPLHGRAARLLSLIGPALLAGCTTVSEGISEPYNGHAALVIDGVVAYEEARVKQSRFHLTPRPGVSCEQAYALTVNPTGLFGPDEPAAIQLVSTVPLHEGQRVPLPERQMLNGLFGGEGRIVTLGDFELVLEIEGSVWCEQPADLDEDPSPCEPVDLGWMSVTYAWDDGYDELALEHACAEPSDAWTELWGEPLCAAPRVCEGKGADAG